MEEGPSWHECVLVPTVRGLAINEVFAVLHYATQLVERYNHLLEYYERNNSVRKGQLAQSDQELTESQGQLLTRHGDYSRMMGHWVATTNNLDSALGNVEPGLRHQQRNSPNDEKHDATRQQ